MTIYMQGLCSLICTLENYRLDEAESYPVLQDNSLFEFYLILQNVVLSEKMSYSLKK